MDAAQRDLNVFQTLSKNTAAGRIPYQHLFDYLDNRSALDAKERTQLDLTELTAQIQKHPDQPRDLYLLAEANLKLGKVDEARKTIAQLDEISANDYRTQTEWGCCWRAFVVRLRRPAFSGGGSRRTPIPTNVKFNLGGCLLPEGFICRGAGSGQKVSAAGQQDDTFLVPLLGDIQAHLYK